MKVLYDHVNQRKLGMLCLSMKIKPHENFRLYGTFVQFCSPSFISKFTEGKASAVKNYIGKMQGTCTCTYMYMYVVCMHMMYLYNGLHTNVLLCMFKLTCMRLFLAFWGVRTRTGMIPTCIHACTTT